MKGRAHLVLLNREEKQATIYKAFMLYFAEFFQRQFCDAHTCDAGRKLFPEGKQVG